MTRVGKAPSRSCRFYFAAAGELFADIGHQSCSGAETKHSARRAAAQNMTRATGTHDPPPPSVGGGGS